MSSSPEISASSVPVAEYAAVAPRRGLAGSRIWVIAAAVIAIGALGVAGGRMFGIFGKLMPSGPHESSIYVVSPQTLEISLAESGELKPKNSVEVKCEVEGQSTIIWIVPESTRVKKGDKLVELASDELKNRTDSEEVELEKITTELDSATQELSITRNENASKINKAKIALEVADLELKRYLQGDFEKSKKAAEIEIKQTEMELVQKTNEYQNNLAMLERQFVSRTKLEESEIAMKRAEMARDKALLEMDILNLYEKPKNQMQKASDLEQAREELEREQQRAESREKQQVAKVEEQTKLLAIKQTRVKKLREQLDKTKIVAPIDGIVQYAGEESNWRFGGNRIAAGEKAFEGQILISLPDTSQMLVRTRVHEADRHHVKEGLVCWVKVPALPNRRFSGKISKISTFADSANRWLNPNLKEHTTEILLDETDGPLSPGDSAEISIEIEELPDVLAVPVQSVFTRGEKRFVFAERNGEYQPVEISTGRSNTNFVQVTEGLAANDRVLMQASKELLTKLPEAKPGRTKDGPAGGEPGRRGQGPRKVADGGGKPGGAAGGGAATMVGKPEAVAGAKVVASETTVGEKATLVAGAEKAKDGADEKPAEGTEAADAKSTDIKPAEEKKDSGKQGE